MSIAIVYSTSSVASKNIANELEKIGIPNWAKMYQFDEDEIGLPLDTINEEVIIVLSKHKSAAGTKSFTVHSIGNFSNAEYGGKEKTLVNSLPKIQTNLLRGLTKENDSEHLICFEVTHHGPFTKKSVCFIELGSSAEEWNNLTAAALIAKTIIKYTKTENNDKIVIGIGGGHYTPDFTKLAVRKNYSFGHICPNYMLKELDIDLLKQMIEKTGANEIVLDWKGLKTFKEKVVALCEESNLPYVRVQKLLKN
jgi:D-aminoacyl-tRNA deacylase